MNRHAGHIRPRGARGSRVATRAGFTLVEAIATMVVLAALGSATVGVITAVSRGYDTAAARADLVTEGATVLDRVTRELHNINLRSGAMAPDVSAVTRSSITWNGASSLTLSGGSLRLVDGGALATTLATGVSAFVVEAYDESNARLGGTLSGSACDPIRRLSISLTLQRAGVLETLRTKVFLRCTVEGAAP
jgi:hypothetical protein